MTDKEIRIISRKRAELIEKVKPSALINFLVANEVTKEDLKDKEKVRSQVEAIESIGKMNFLDELMKDMGYAWDSFGKLYIETGKSGKKSSYADAWDEVTGRKKNESEEDDDSSDDEHNCDECDLNGRCPIQKARKIMDDIEEFGKSLEREDD